MYAMRYGTVPIVRNSGGLANIIVDAGAENISRGLATGFHFQEPCSAELLACIYRALALYRQPIIWRKLQLNGMDQDFSWHRSAEAYANVYRSLVRLPRARAASQSEVPTRLIA